MATSNLFQIVKTRKLKMGVPELLSGVSQLLLKLCPSADLALMGLNPHQTILALGQKMRQAPSEAAYVAQPEIEGVQRAYNRFLHKASALALFSMLISRLPKKFFSGPGAIWVLDDTPLSKSGSLMPQAGKFYHNGDFYHGYELPLLASHTDKGVFPMAFSLKGKNCPSKIALSKELLQKAMDKGFSPDYLVFDAWFTTEELIDFADEKNLRFVGPLKSNRILWLHGRKTSPQKLLKKLKDRTYQDFEVTLSNGKSYRMVVFKRQLSSKKFQYEFLLTNDPDSHSKVIAQAYLKRWGIETLFRSAKQSFGLEKFHNRTWKAIVNHLAFCFCSILLVAYLRSLFKTLQGKSLAVTKTLAFFKRVKVVLKAQKGFSMLLWQCIPNPLYFNTFELHS